MFDHFQFRNYNFLYSYQNIHIVEAYLLFYETLYKTDYDWVVSASYHQF
jgi:hypothetical protein